MLKATTLLDLIEGNRNTARSVTYLEGENESREVSYGELYERHLGQKSPLKLERRLNNLSGNGGLIYAPSFQ